MKRLRLVLALGLAAAAVAVGVQAATGTNTKDAARPPVRLAPIFRDVNFVSTCRFSHRNQDDPIVFPSQPGKSHDHTFFGNDTTSAGSTLSTMLAGTTTCQRPADTAGYWVPTLLQNGTPVVPVGATIYYRRRTLMPVQAFPTGFKMIAGNSHAMDAQSTRIVFWNCGVAGGVAPTPDIPTCPGGRAFGLRLHVRFPNCWNGTQLDSADHMSHMAYAVDGVCPLTHPFAVSQITVIVNYGIAGGAGLELSSGGQHTGHADFFNSWQESELQALVKGCLDGLRHCGRGGFLG